MSTTPMPVPQQPNSLGVQQQAPSVAGNVMPIAKAAQDVQTDKPGVTAAQMGQAPKAQPDPGSKKRIILSVLGAAAGLGPMVKAVNQQHNQNTQIQNQHVIDTVWNAHNAQTQAQNQVERIKKAVGEIDQHWNEALNLPDDDPNKRQSIAYLAAAHQDAVASLKQAAGVIQDSQQQIQGLLADPKNRKIMEKAVGYDEKSANAPERQQMIAAIRKSVPGTSPEEAQLESQFPQAPTEGQKGLSGPVTEQVLKSATEESKLQATAAGGGKQTTDTRQRADFAAFKQQHPEYTGSEEQWVSEQKAVGGATGRASVPVSRDDKFIAIAQKFSEGKPLTSDDKAYMSAYRVWNKERNIDPGMARAAAFAANRYIPILDPNNPEQVTFMRAGDAAKTGALSPASISFQTDKGITAFMTRGQGGQNIAIFNTAIDHLRIMEDAAKALQNGDIQGFNKLANAWSNATGGPAPNDFNTVKVAVAGEIAKTFNGVGATIPAIQEISGTINSAQSPDQIAGAITYYKKLMDSKLSALGEQYTAGKAGKPAFKDTTPSTPGAPKVGTIENGYRFKGGDPGQQSSWEKVK